MFRRPTRTSLLTLLALSFSALAGRAAEQPIDELGEELSGYRDNRPTDGAAFLSGGASLQLTPVPDDRSSVLDLNGTWFIQSGASRTVQDADSQEFVSWNKITVPGDAVMRGVSGTPGYIRSFTVPVAELAISNVNGNATCRITVSCRSLPTSSKAKLTRTQPTRHTGPRSGIGPMPSRTSLCSVVSDRA